MLVDPRRGRLFTTLEPSPRQPPTTRSDLELGFSILAIFRDLPRSSAMATCEVGGAHKTTGAGAGAGSSASSSAGAGPSADAQAGLSVLAWLRTQLGLVALVGPLHRVPPVPPPETCKMNRMHDLNA